MSKLERVLLAVAILIVDAAVFFVPLTAIAVAALIVFWPRLLVRAALAIQDKEDAL